MLRQYHRARVTATFLISLPLLLAMEKPVRAQAGAYLQQATKRLNDLLMAEAPGYRFPIDSFSIGGALLSKSADWKTIAQVSMVSKQEYKLLAAGDDDALDVDVRVVDEKGNELKKDANAAQTAQLVFQPAMDGRYTIQMRLFNSKKDNANNFLPCYCIAVIMSK